VRPASRTRTGDFSRAGREGGEQARQKHREEEKRAHGQSANRVRRRRKFNPAVQGSDGRIRASSTRAEAGRAAALEIRAQSARLSRGRGLSMGVPFQPHTLRMPSPDCVPSPACRRASRRGRGAGTAGWRLLPILLAIAAGGLRAAEAPTVTFVGVALDAETARADEKLREYLRAKEGLKFEPRDLEYGAAVDTLVSWDVAEQGPLVARVTPYVYIAAQMLGANLDILGTYVSRRTQETTYQSYFVVHRTSGLKTDDLDLLVKYLRGRTTPARFAYHNKFSTSSYLLPALYFRRMGIFSAGTPNSPEQRHIFIRAEQPAGVDGSAELVRLVKQRRVEIAAVWDGTQSKFADDPDLRFIKLPYTLPNDLLVFTTMPERACCASASSRACGRCGRTTSRSATSSAGRTSTPRPRPGARSPPCGG
jgi:ABC-type phosphate/phosphonate transport system substrate-binding protein